jgi:hypothetical protein
MFEYNKQNDFTSQAADFATQKSQLNSLAKTKITNKSSTDKELQGISDALNSKDIAAAQENFNTFLSHIDQSKLSAQTKKDMVKLRDTLESGNVEDSIKAMAAVQKEAKQIYSAYDASKAFSSKSQSQIGSSILDNLANSYA